MGLACAVSSDGGVTWQIQRVSKARWPAQALGGVVNGIGLRERAERLADGTTFWAYGDGRHAGGSGPAGWPSTVPHRRSGGPAVTSIGPDPHRRGR